MLAKKTLALIDEKIELDGGNSFRKWLEHYIPRMGDAYAQNDNEFRSHLGASSIGRDCLREIWYGWRWYKKAAFEGRMLRLFNRGHLEEARFLALLKMIGCEVWNETTEGKQFRVSGFKGHFGGSCDAVIKGIPDLPHIPMLAEFKTHGDSSFSGLLSKGLILAKWEHYVQMQIYMAGLGLTHGVYFAVNKNNDELYAEIIELNQDVIQRTQEKIITLVEATEPPPRMTGASPTWYKCKFCNYKGICHNGEVPNKTCRSCAWLRIEPDGSWACSNTECYPEPAILTKEEQLGLAPFCPYYKEVGV